MHSDVMTVGHPVTGFFEIHHQGEHCYKDFKNDSNVSQTSFTILANMIGQQHGKGSVHTLQAYHTSTCIIGLQFVQ